MNKKENNSTNGFVTIVENYEESEDIFSKHKGSSFFPKQPILYTEEEVILYLQMYRVALSEGSTPILGDTTKGWFEQYKKK